MPNAIRNQVVRHYRNKVIGRKSSSEEMGAKNIFKLFKLVKVLKVDYEDSEYRLTFPTRDKTIKLCARQYPSSDLVTLIEVWGKMEYELSIRSLNSLGSTEPLIVDAGGNVGYSTAYFKHHFPLAKIICIEPDRSNLLQVKKNIDLNSFEDVSIIEGALWKQTSKLQLRDDYRQGTNASFYVVESSEGDVEGYKLEDLLSDQNWKYIDLLKMDIEGGEKYLLEDEEVAAGILSKSRLIAIEIHDEKANRNKILEVLKLNGFECVTVGETTFGENKLFKY
ncbi:MAG: FkbM family methyltransferase [Cyclobacteriaceae bacterium]